MMSSLHGRPFAVGTRVPAQALAPGNEEDARAVWLEELEEKQTGSERAFCFRVGCSGLGCVMTHRASTASGRSDT